MIAATPYEAFRQMPVKSAAVFLFLESLTYPLSMLELATVEAMEGATS